MVPAGGRPRRRRLRATVCCPPRETDARMLQPAPTRARPAPGIDRPGSSADGLHRAFPKAEASVRASPFEDDMPMPVCSGDAVRTCGRFARREGGRSRIRDCAMPRSFRGRRRSAFPFVPVRVECNGDNAVVRRWDNDGPAENHPVGDCRAPGSAPGMHIIGFGRAPFRVSFGELESRPATGPRSRQDTGAISDSIPAATRACRPR